MVDDDKEGIVRIGDKIQSQTYTLTPKGKLLGGMEAGALRKNIEQLMQSGVRHLILDLSNVQWINGPGVEFLFMTLHQFKKINGSLTLKGPSKRIQNVLEITNLRSFFNILVNQNTTTLTKTIPISPKDFPKTVWKFLPTTIGAI